jgi:hypothetical protein
MEEPTTFEEQIQPQGLKVLCVLTFIFSGIVGFCVLLAMVFTKPVFAKLNESYDTLSSNSSISEAQLQQIQKILEFGSGKFIIACGVYLLILGLSFFGALQMWQMKYKGFIMYLIANVCFLVSNIITLNIFMAIFDILFIVLYYVQRKELKK